MHSATLSAAAALLLASSAAVAAAAPSGGAKAATSALAGVSGNPVPKFGAPPKWVRQEPAPEADPESDLPFQFLLSNAQEKLTRGALENFVEYVVQPSNQAGLQAVGTVTIPWNVNRADLTLNHVTIERDGKTIDALRRDDLSVIRRESGLEKSSLTGIQTVVLPVRGLQAGDRLRVGFTYNSRFRFGPPEEVQDLTAQFPVQRIVRRIVVDEGLSARWSVDPSVKQVATESSPGTVERVFALDNVQPAKKRSFVPDRFRLKLVQVSTYGSWAEVADPLIPLFDEARKLRPDSPVAALAETIAAAHSDSEGRMLAALRAAQEEVRYVALLLGDGDYSPESADDVWASRLGDCKGKTALLLALLDRLGISAEPVLTSVAFEDGLERRLPSLAMLDHMYVRARIGGTAYFLDGTKYGQRTLEELQAPPTRHGIPLVPNSTLETFADTLPTEPLQETLLVWDATKGVTGDVPFEATLVLRDTAAAALRGETVSSTDRDKLTDALKNRVPGVPNDAMELVALEPENPDGSYVVRFKGTAEIDWTPVDGLKGNRMQLSQSTITWDGEFDRESGDGRELPVLMAFPYWERSTEKVILPNGGKDFRLEAKAFERTVAATRISRSATHDDGVVTVVNDFKRLHRELGAEEARAAKEHLEEISEDYAYVVSRKKLDSPD